MSNTIDTELRFRARNLAGKTMQELVDLTAELNKGRKDEATAAGLAAKSVRQLATEQRQLSAVSKEIARRRDTVQGFVNQQTEIQKTSARLAELTNRYRQLSSVPVTAAGLQEMQRLGREIIETNGALGKLVAGNTKAEASLRKVGSSADTARADLVAMDRAVDTSRAAYTAAVGAVERHADATRRAGAAAAEAAARQAQAAREVQRSQAAFAAASGRASELSALRADIEARSRQAQAIEVATEAQRRSAAEALREAAARDRANAAIRESVQAYDQQRARRAAATAAFTTGLAAQEREAQAEQAAIGRKNRLIALINSERGQRVLAAEAKRRETAQLQQNTGARTANSRAVDQGTRSLGLFNDVGRKSLGTYQRIRGQVLGLTAAYVGVYQAIATFQRAIETTNRDTSLRLGLRTINDGNTEKAAADYEFLRKEAERLGLVFDDLAPQYANIAISGKALGMSTRQIRQVFSDTALAAAGLNLSVDDTDGLFRAMTQIFSKGKVQAEELRQQLGDRLPGAVVKFAQASNMSLQELEKRLEQGTIGVGFLTKGIEGYAAAYAKEIDTIGNRLQATMNRATNAYNEFLRSLVRGENEEKLKQAFQGITDFFRSDEGTQFAGKLADAIGVLITSFITLTKNIDLVVLAIKAFVGLMAVKAVVEFGIAIAGATTAIRGMVTWLTAQRAAATAAATATGRLAAQSRLLGLALGPVGIALTAVAAAALSIERNYDKASEATDQLIGKMKRLSEARGEDAQAASRQAADIAQQKLAELRQAEADLAAARARGPGDFLPTIVDRVFDTNFSVTKAEERVAQLRQELELASVTAQNASRRFRDFLDQPAEAETELPVTIDPEKKDTNAAAAGRAMREANARANAARALQKELLDIDQEIFKSQIDGALRTSDQVQKNYELTIKGIESQYEESLLAIERLEQNVRTANNGAVPAAEAAQIALIRERAGLLKEARNMRALEESDMQVIQISEKAINDLIDERNAKIAYYNTLRETGAMSDADAYVATIRAQDDYNARIRTLIEELLPQLQAIDPNSNLYHALGVPQLIAGLQQAKAEMVKLTDAQRVALSVGKQFASGMAASLVELGRQIANAADSTQSWSDAFKNAMDAFRTFAADFLQQIAEMILQATILQAIKNAISGGSGGYWQAVVGAFTQHTGGIAGSGGLKRRNVDASVFAGAQYAGRFHQGGLPGLKSNEVATILEKGEEVVTADNPRHIANAGQSGPVNIDMITTLDPVDVLSAGLRSGRQTVVNDLTTVFRNNRSTLRTALGV